MSVLVPYVMKMSLNQWAHKLPARTAGVYVKKHTYEILGI